MDRADRRRRLARRLLLDRCGGRAGRAPGPVRDALAEALDRFDRAMLREVRNAVEAGDLPAGTDPEQIVFELRGVVMAANQQLQLNNDPRAAQRAHAAVRRILGLAG